jgi:putative hydrolase of HD superfamily
MSGDGTPPRLASQLAFLVELDKLKTVLRRTSLIDRSRAENTAEHSWHIAVAAVLLEEHAVGHGVDLLRVVKMLLIHDVVEIDAGDTFCYDAEANRDKLEREERAAERLFGLLPADQAAELRALWEEFEARETAEARYAAALDRIQPVLQNLHTEGHSWRAHGIGRAQVVHRNRPIGDAAPEIWEHLLARLDEAVERGHLEP